MGKLLACPFCRELFAEGEVSRCPSCDIALTDLAKLPPSADAIELEELSVLDSPFDRKLPPFYPGRGRLLLAALALLGLGAFFLPWVGIERPDPATLSGFDLARRGARWLFGGAVGWFLLLPLVASRRSVNEMRGARALAVLFPLMSVAETVLMATKPPAESDYVTSGLAFAPAFYGTLGLGVIAAIVGFRFGGNPDDLKDLVRPLGASPRRPGEAVH